MTSKQNKRWKPSQKDIELVRQLSGVRVPMEGIATILGISKKTLETHLKKNETLRLALDEGRQKASTKARQTLYRLATEERTVVETTTLPNGLKRVKTYVEQPDIKALTFWCETQEGFKRTEAREHSGPGGAPIKTEDVTKPKTLEELEAELAKLQAESKNLDV